jgi:hypothetical protein
MLTRFGQSVWNGSNELSNVIRLNQLVAAFLRNRAVVRGSISAAIVLCFLLFGVISFLWMVGPEVVSHYWLGIGKGTFSESNVLIESHAEQ